jgi:hypothetical protein
MWYLADVDAVSGDETDLFHPCSEVGCFVEESSLFIGDVVEINLMKAKMGVLVPTRAC